MANTEEDQSVQKNTVMQSLTTNRNIAESSDMLVEDCFFGLRSVTIALDAGHALIAMTTT